MPRKKKPISPKSGVVKEDEFAIILKDPRIKTDWKKFIEALSDPLRSQEEDGRNFIKQQKMMLAHMIVLRWGDIIDIKHEKKDKNGVNEKGAKEREAIYARNGEILYYLLKIIDIISREYFFAETVNPEGFYWVHHTEQFSLLDPSLVLYPIEIFERLFIDYKWGSLSCNQDGKTKFRELFKHETQRLRKFENPYESGKTKDFFDCVIELATSSPKSRYCQEFIEHSFLPLLEHRDLLVEILGNKKIQKKDFQK